MKTTFEIKIVDGSRAVIFTLPNGETRTSLGVKNPKAVSKAIDALWDLTPYDHSMAEVYAGDKY